MIKELDKLLMCPKCKWFHMPVSRKDAERSVKEFNDFFDMSNPSTKEMYGNKKEDISNYEHCFLCRNSYKNSVWTDADKCPIGATLQSLIVPED